MYTHQLTHTHTRTLCQKDLSIGIPWPHFTPSSHIDRPIILSRIGIQVTCPTIYSPSPPSPHLSPHCNPISLLSPTHCVAAGPFESKSLGVTVHFWTGGSAPVVCCTGVWREVCKRKGTAEAEGREWVQLLWKRGRGRGEEKKKGRRERKKGGV